MATRKETIIHIIDDYTQQSIDGKAVKVALTYKSERYELDLSEKSAEALDKAVRPFLEHTEPLKGTARQSKPRTKAAGDGDVVRSWAKAQGLEVNQRGRLSKEVIEKYNAAHGF